MLGPRLKVKEIYVVAADSPEELCQAVNTKLGELELQGLPVYCEKTGKWIQFLVETVLVVPKEMLGQQAPSNIVPVQGRLQPRP